MTTPLPNKLQQIVDHKTQELASAKESQSLRALQQRIEHAEPPRDFVQALRQTMAQGQPAIIAEFKRASPSKGWIWEEAEPASVVAEYEQAGAACLSVLTEAEFFKGSAADLQAAKAASSLPILRKDFIIDLYQIYESRALGADCILLIAAILSESFIEESCQLARSLGMAALIEIHSQAELNRVQHCSSDLIGINNRNLKTFATDVQLSLDLAPKVPKDKVVISESGIHDVTMVQRLRENDVHAFLVGEHLMAGKAPGERLSAYFQRPMK